MGMFDKLPSSCLVCGTAFDKKDKEMVTKWRVEVYNDPASVKLYCPDCWEYADSTKDYLNKQDMNVNKKDNKEEKEKAGYGAWNYNLQKMRKK
jgi:hypothetical protein